MKVLVVDNYDSFTYNLVQYLGELGASPVVWRNDRFRLEEVEALDPDRILISLGPAPPLRRGFPCPWSSATPPVTPSWGSAWATRPSGRSSGGRWSPRPWSCTAR